MSTPAVVPPPISWAQRNDLLYVIINVECKDIDYKFTDDSMQFKGTSVLNTDVKYEVTLNFFNKINPEKVTSKNIGRCLEFTVYKEKSGPYWEKLTTDKQKLNFLKVDFNKWKDDDDSEPENDTDIQSLMSQISQGQGAGAGGGKPYFDDFEDEEEDSDDENLPQLSSEQDEEEEAKKN